MATVLVKSSASGFGTMNPNLHRSASVASASAPMHGAIGSRLLSKTMQNPDAGKTSNSTSSSFQYSMSPPIQPGSIDGRLADQQDAAILMRKLPRNLTREALRSMLLFAKDLFEVEFVPSDSDEDVNYLTAVAHFGSLSAAKEARAMLDGKPNSTGQATMSVIILPNASAVSLARRNTVDHGSSRNLSQTMSPTGTMAPLARQSSRFNGTFQSMERTSPSDSGTNGHADMSSPDGASGIQAFFSPQSPIGNSINDRPRMSGKSVIGEDNDEDTSDIINDPLSYLPNEYSVPMTQTARRPTNSHTNSHLPLGRFANLSLSTNVSSPPSSSFTSPRPPVSLNSPSAMSPNNYTSLNGPPNFPQNSHQYPRHNYPPVNPADQNPPCNTLYVGNLPLDTSEDELKTMFSKQRGYKRLCFRTKQNGPMCFVEFEDVSFATKALNDLYGAALHNSVKGGIRLSFSKNPLGVRAGQPGSANPTMPLTPQSGLPTPSGLTSASGQNFMNANGPPPGLSAPPGLGMPMSSMGMPPPQYNHSMNPMTNKLGYANGGIGAVGKGGMRPMPQYNSYGNGQGPPPDYMLGR